MASLDPTPMVILPYCYGIMAAQMKGPDLEILCNMVARVPRAYFRNHICFLVSGIDEALFVTLAALVQVKGSPGSIQ